MNFILQLDNDTGLLHYILIASSTAMLVHKVMQGVVVDDRATPKTPNLSVSDLAALRQTELNKAIAFWNSKQKASDDE